MNQKRNQEQIWFAASIFLLLRFTADATVPNCVERYRCECISHDVFDGLSDRDGREAGCIRQYPQLLDWESAESVCRAEYSHLFNTFDHRVGDIVKEQGIELMWLGIRRVYGFYVNLSVDPNFFKESKKEWSRQWDVGEPVHDCVALNVTSGRLLTRPCSTHLRFICQYEGVPSDPVPSFACPDGRYFTYLNPIISEKCARNLANISVDPTPTINISPTAEVLPHLLESFPSTDKSKDLLTCKLQIEGVSSRQIRDQAFFHWFKNGIPISKHTYLFDVRFYPDPLKFTTSPVSRQGFYRCGATLPGFTETILSPELNFFYSDFSTHILTLKGEKKEISYEDYSQSGFRSFKSKLKKSMALLTESLMESYPKPVSNSSLSWDFQNVSASGHLVAVKVLLYVKQNDPLSAALQNVPLIQKFWKSSVEEKKGWTVSSLKIDSADMCSEETVPSSVTSCDDVLKWRETKQTRIAVSEPLCLKGWKLVTRECKPNLVDGAQWGAFNYSLCSQYQPAIQDLEVTCPGGFRNLKPNLCYAIHREARTLDEARELCHSSSSYLMDSSLPDTKLVSELEPLVEYWISPKFSHLGYEWPGAEIENEESLVLKDLSLLKMHSLGLRCVSVTFHTQFNFSTTDCNRKLPFVCIHQTYKPSTSIMFSRSWHKFQFQSSCFSTDDSKKTWEEATTTCRKHSPNSSLLQSVQNMEDYPYIKFLLHTLEPFKTAGSWWMNLVQENDTLKWLSSPEKPVTFVDWDVHTDFNLTAGLLSTYAEDRIHWTLRDPSSKERFICEMRNCRDTRPSLVYIEDKEISSSNSSDLHLFFHFHCASSGWFVSDSISWYKDGLPLIENSALDEFTLNVTVPFNVTNFGLFQGYYWCSMKQEKSFQERFSSKVLKRVADLHTFVVSVESQPLQDASSFQCSNFLKQERYRAFKVFIETSNDKLFSSDGVLHNISCNSTCIRYHVQFYARNADGDEKKLRNDLESIMKTLKPKQDELESVLHKIHVEITSISVRSTIACLEEKTNHSGRHITWPSVSIGETTMPEELYVTEDGHAVERKCLGDFYVGAFWSPAPEGQGLGNGNQVTESLHKLSKTKIDEGNILNSSQNLEMLTNSSQDLEPVAVHFVAQILNNIATVPVVEPQVLFSVINAVDNVIDAKRSMVDNREASSNVSSEISAAVERIVSNVHTAGQTVKVAGSNIAVTLLPVNSHSSKIPKGGVLKMFNSNVTTLFDRDDFDSFGTFETGVIIPDNLIAQMQTANASDITIIVKRNYSSSYSKDVNIVSPVIDVNLRNFSIPHGPLYPRVKMEFEVSKIDTSNGTLQCVFWDQMLNNMGGGWSYKGCNSLPRNSSRIRCECDHLTNFAIILDLKPGSHISVVHKRTLNVITYIGCCLSLFGLGFTILTFILFRKWRKDMKFKALFNLSLALASFLLIFLFGIEKGSSEIRCMAVAILLHYLMLASFTWMLVEAFIQYLNLVKVIGTYIPRFIQKAMLFGWGLPLVVVVIVLSVDHKLYISKHEYCWLSDTVFYLAVASPVLFMLTVNFGIFGLILYSNTCGRDKNCLRKNQNSRKESLTRARAIFCVSVMLGLSWVFGFLAAVANGGLKILFQYLFAITTTSQGFFIFIFYVFRHKPTRSLWWSLITPSTTPDVSHISHNTGGTEVTKGHNTGGGSQGRFSNVFFKAKPSYTSFNTSVARSIDQ